MRHSLRRALLLQGMIGIVGSALPALALAQSPGAAPPAGQLSGADASGGSASPRPPEVGEVVVTAEFRAQNIQNTPLAITAVNAAGLESRSMTSVVDLTAVSPSLQIRSGGSAYGPAPQIYIRGIGQVETMYAYEPGVGLYVDDVYYGSALGSVISLLDLDRVEILRGPQGTLEGMNSVGGAIKLFSKAPTGEKGGYVELGYGSLNTLQARGSINVPLVADKLALRLSGMALHRDGYLTRLDFGCTHPGSGVPSALVAPNCRLGTEGGVNTHAGRAALRWTPSDRLEVNLVGTLAVDNSEIGATKLLAAKFKTNIPAGFDQDLLVTGPHDYTNYATYMSPAYTDPAKYAGLPGAGSHPATAVKPESNSISRIASAKVDYKLTDAVSLTSITGYQHIDGNYGKDIDLTPFPVNTINYIFSHKQFTQELRLNAQLGKLVDLTIGGFYYHADSGFSGVQINQPGYPSQNVFALNDIIKATNKSAFAHAVLHVTDRLNLTGGIRYTDDRKTYQFGRRDPYDLSLPALASSGAIDGVVGRYSGNHVDYRADIDYRWSDSLMTYAQISTGFRGGGVNPRPYVAEQATPFGPETVTAYEAGFKSDLIGRTLRLNGDVFINKYDGIVFFDRTPTPHSVLNATPVNAGNGTFKGAEVELDYRPAGGLTIEGSASYLHFHLDKVSAAGANIASANPDAQAPNAPNWQASLGVQYEFDAGGHGTITPRIDVDYQSYFYADLANTEISKTEGRTIVNARVTWKSNDGDWQASLAATNLFDRFYYFSKVQYPVGATVGALAPPREVTVSLRRNF
jgi:iron complex outermembrane receptor protein